MIATGGGAPTDETNRAALWGGNLVVWLDAPVGVLAQRVGAAGSGRPLLAGGAAARLGALAAARRPVYATATVRLDTAERPPEAVAGAIVEILSGEAAGGG